jgi:hypothetical protein
MCDFQDFAVQNYPEWDYIKLDETIILCPLHVSLRDCEKFAVIQDIDTNPKFHKKVLELWNYEKEKESILTKIEKDKSLYEKIKAVVLTHK